MSVARVETVKKSRKDQGKCGKCGTELPAGSGYLYFYVGFRSNYKHVRCLKAECYPKPSERESSMAAGALAAKEAFEASIDELETVEDIQAAVQEVADGFREVSEEYQGSLDGWENGNEQLQERVDHYEDQASELENWSWDGSDEYEPCDLHTDASSVDRGECPECMQAEEQWIQEVRTSAEDAVNSAETM